MHRLQLQVRRAAREQHVLNDPRSDALEISIATGNLAELAARALADLTSLEQQGVLDDLHRILTQGGR